MTGLHPELSTFKAYGLIDMASAHTENHHAGVLVVLQERRLISNSGV
jgi:hypothetical protein